MRLIILLGVLLLWSAQSNAEFEAGVRAFARNDGARAFAEFVPDAEAGHPGAQYYLAQLLEKGKGVAADESAAVKWYKRAAEQSHRHAMAELGIRYDLGRGVPKNSAEAAHWLRKAADADSTVAMNRLAKLYLNGTGVSADSVQAYAWAGLAARRTRPEMPEKGRFVADRDAILSRLTPDQRAKGEALLEMLTDRFKRQRSLELNPMKPYNGPGIR